MLKELGPVSVVAVNALKQGRSGPPAGPVTADIGERVARKVGDLSSQEMLLATSPVPALLEDATSVPPISDDELKATGAFLSTESIFARYKSNLPQVAAPAAGSGEPASETAVTPAGGAVGQPPALADIPGRPSRLGVRPEPAATPETKPISRSEVVPVAATALGTPAAPAPSEMKPAMPVGTNQRGVMVVTQPGEAVIIFDDNPSLTCKTPCQFPLAPGRHTMKITRAGYRDLLKIFTVERNGSDRSASWLCRQRPGPSM